MKHIVLLLFLTVAITATAQNLPEYKASNGITYKPGDTVKLGRGSHPNGDFRYLQMGGLAASGGDADNIGKHYSGMNVIIKKIKTQKMKGAEKVWFIVGAGNIVNYNLAIEDAIATCEVEACKGSQPAASVDKYDQLAKLKGLLDSGVITQEEYDKEKKKLLDQ